MSDMKHDFSTPLKFCLKLKLRELQCVTSKEIRQTNKQTPLLIHRQSETPLYKCRGL
jgi:hypothetical protein